jgi:hypothetical protein
MKLSLSFTAIPFLMQTRVSMQISNLLLMRFFVAAPYIGHQTLDNR